jgi:hypothetical protein
MLNFYLNLSDSNVQGIALFKGTLSLVVDRKKRMNIRVGFDAS